MKTTTNRNERRPAAPRPAAKVLRYEMRAAGYRLTYPRAPPRFLSPRFSTLRARARVSYYRRMHDTCARSHIVHDYISFLNDVLARARARARYGDH